MEEKKTKKETITFRLREDTKAAVLEAAEQEGRTMSNFVVRLIEEELKRRQQ